MEDFQVNEQAELVESELLEWPDFVGQVESNGNIFAILDACDEPLIPPKAIELGDQAVSLYHGDAARDFTAIAPYLVEVDKELAEWILQELGNRAWGFFVLASQESTLAEVRRHFRKFLMVRGPEDDEFYFRFYDPRLLPNFLKSLGEDEVSEFFGPCRGFAILSGEQVRLFRPVDIQVSGN